MNSNTLVTKVPVVAVTLLMVVRVLLSLEVRVLLRVLELEARVVRDTALILIREEAHPLILLVLEVLILEVLIK